MARVKYYKCLKSALPAIGNDADSLYFTTDTLEIYKSTGEFEPLVLYSDVFFVNTLPTLGLVNKLYITATDELYRWVDGEWELVVSQALVNAHTTSINELIILNKNMSIEMDTVKNAMQSGITDNVYVDTLATSNNITITNGTFDSTNRKVILETGDSLEIKMSNLVSQSTKPNNMTISGSMIVPVEASLQIYSCNNGLDENPAWEDITSIYNSKQIHTFTNSTKTNTNWAVGIKIIITKNTAISEISIKGFGISYN